MTAPSSLVSLGLLLVFADPALALRQAPDVAADSEAEPESAPAPAAEPAAEPEAAPASDPAPADASEPASQPDPAGESASAGISPPKTGAQSRDLKRKDVKWIRRWAPERNMGEIGVFGGVFLPALDHDFYAPQSGQKPLWAVAGDVGLRGAFFPLPYLGVEVEGAAIPGKIRSSTNDPAILWAARGHVILQLPFWNVVPFVLGGAGAMGISSPPILLGKDVDPVAHWGGGVKLYINRWIGLRVEARHVIGAKEATQRSFTNHAEILGGLIITLGRAKPEKLPPPDPDRDDDGFLNDRDNCPDTPGVSPDGCPPRDTDEDGFVDTEDACPYEKGVEPDGCPIRDDDGDGIPNDRDGTPDDPDGCKDKPETDNGWEDEDGCPDELPEKIKEFSGVIEGIEFELDSAIIRDVSKEILDRAVKVLEEYPDIRIEIVGHTDDEGTTEYNEKLSRERAEAVEKYLVDKGIDDARLETRGAGESEPLTSNATEEGKAKNRRTEFKIIKRAR
jgi:OOP family OmpA-OmpF porin